MILPQAKQQLSHSNIGSYDLVRLTAQNSATLHNPHSLSSSPYYFSPIRDNAKTK